MLAQKNSSSKKLSLEQQVLEAYKNIIHIAKEADISLPK